MLPYALTILISAFLLFQVQPLVAKYILPWFGGTPAVWTTSMLFFQTALLAGYAYAHFSIRRFSARTQALVHAGLLALALIQLPIIPEDAWKPTSIDAPTGRILLLLGATIGLPYLALSATAPLVQGWFSRAHPGRSPYRLYALSNTGSLFALLSFPFLFEPLLARRTMAITWSVGFGLFAILCAVTGYLTWRTAKTKSEGMASTQDDGNAPRPAPQDYALWAAFAFVAVVLLLAITNQITQDVAAIPFLWVLPLSLYLLTFIIAFDAPRWYVRPLFAGLLVPALGGMVYMLYQLPNVLIEIQIAVYCTILFLACMVCHGEAARLKPHPRYLTGFYLMLSVGGALGGIFVAIIAPAIFNDFIEVHIGLAGVVLLALVAFFLDKNWLLYRGRPTWAWIPLVAGFMALVIVLASHVVRIQSFAVTRSRNFYGVLAIEADDEATPEETLWLVHGVIYHGVQYTDPLKRRWATSYFSQESGVGLAMLNYKPEGGRRIGIVGMGVGTLATYGLPGDVIRVYEINPQVKRYAESYFTYLEDSLAEVEVVLGDGRLALEQEESQNYDILVLDAFSSDAIPVHLLTREAFQTYTRHMQPEGLIIVNVINRHIDVEPVVRKLAAEFGLQAVKIDSPSGPGAVRRASWMILTLNEAFLDIPAIRDAYVGVLVSNRDVRLWTDDYSSLFPLLKLR